MELERRQLPLILRKEYFQQFLYNRKFLWLLFYINLFGTIYGFWWYKYQIEATQLKWVIFVPDSPTGSLFFTIFLWLYLHNKKIPIIEAIGAITSFKYGIWAVAIILLDGTHGSYSLLDVFLLNSITLTDAMLLISHLGMAIEAIIFVSIYSFNLKSIIYVGIWTLINDIVDYVFGQHPYLPQSLYYLLNEIALFTLLLSILSLVLFFILRKRYK